MSDRKISVRTPITQEQAEILRRKYRSKDTGQALAKLLVIGAGLWLLGEAIRSEDAPKRRRKP